MKNDSPAPQARTPKEIADGIVRRPAGDPLPGQRSRGLYPVTRRAQYRPVKRQLVRGHALHTENETARQILYQQGGDCVLSLKRGYWVVESWLHHCLDITLGEERSRVRTPTAARGLGTIRRVVVSLANAAVDQARKENPKTKCNTGSFQKRFGSRRPRATPRAEFRQIPQCPGLKKLKRRVLQHRWQRQIRCCFF